MLFRSGTSDIMVCGGMESMTNTPYLLTKARGGYRMGNSEIYDHMFLDGLEDAYDKGKLMGCYAEDTAETYQFTREDQDAYAIRSLERARRAIEGGAFDDEVAPVTVRERKGDREVRRDEQPLKADIARIPALKPAFRDGGTVTAANSSSISDGAAALVLTTIVRDVPVEFDPEASKFGDFDREAVLKALMNYELRAAANRLPKTSSLAATGAGGAFGSTKPVRIRT